MVTRLFLIISILLGWVGHIQAEELVATVDRTQISEHDSITLTVKYNASLLSGSPDFSPIRQQFNILNNHRKNSFQMINGQTSTWTIWTLTLQPKRKGNLVIPSIDFKGKRTKPIQVRVSKTSASVQKQNKDVFFHIEANKKTAYVQGQILYTEKLYAVSLDNGDINEFQVADAVVQKLGENRQYRTQLNGRTYSVFERRFAIFPQTSGELVIPGPRYSGEISRGPWQPGRPVSATHPPLKIQVLPQPTQYPQAPWLPASSLDLSYRWSGQPGQMNVGEPNTLYLTIKATGLSGAQLPPVPLGDVAQLKYYPDQATTDDASSEQGVTGSRTQKIAVVATEPGEFSIPEIRIPWWNTLTNQIEYAAIPPQTIKVAGAQLNNSVANDSLADIPTNAPATIEVVKTDAGWWPWLTLITTMLWVATAYLYWRHPRTQIVHSALPEALAEVKAAKLKDIKTACRAGDPVAARAAILSWVNGQLATPINGLAELSHQTPDIALSQALAELDHTLYAPMPNNAWQGEHLWQLIKNWSPETTAARSDLNALYPNTELAVR